MKGAKNRICPVELAGSLDNRLRRWVQNPRKILGPYIEEGMTVLDLGCGPGYFTLDLARMVGPAGRVVAADLQEGMLEKIRVKTRGTELEPHIVLHRCEPDRIGLLETVDFILAFYMIHEVSDPEALFNEMASILKPAGRLLIVEPPVHVSRKAFEATVAKAKAAGLNSFGRPKVFFSKAVLLEKEIPPILA